MTLKAFLGSLEDLDQATASLYRETDAGYVLDVEPVEGYALEDVAGLKKVVSELQAKNQRQRDALKAWSELKPDEVRASLEELEALRLAGADQKAKFAEQVKAHESRIESKYKAQLEEATARANSATQRLRDEMVDRHLAEAISATQGYDHFLRPALRERVKVVDEEGEMHVRVFDGDDVKLAFPKGMTPRPMTVREFVEDLRSDEKWANAFQGAAVGGSGSATTGGRPVASTAAKQHLASLPPTERAAAWRELNKKSGA